MKAKEKLIIGVIVAGAAYVLVSPFLQLLLPEPGAPAPAASQVSDAQSAALVDASSPKPLSKLGAGSEPDIAGSIMHRSEDKDKALQERMLSKMGLIGANHADGKSEDEILAGLSAGDENEGLRLTELSASVDAGKYAVALKQADSFLVYLKEHPHADAHYPVLVNTLAMQAAFKAGQRSKAVLYGREAERLSRLQSDYLIDRIEPTYLRSQGIEADYETIANDFKKFDEEFDARNMAALPALAESLEEKVGALPADSFARLRADMYAVYADLANQGDRQKVSSRLMAVAARADTAGDAFLAQKCQGLVQAIKELK